jgi:upstream activation factor subunit UAF30
MAEREHSKTMAKVPAKPQAKAAPPKAAAKAAPKAAAKAKTAPAKPSVAETAAATVKRLEAQNAQLAKALKDAESRITELERQRDSALDRIEWVIDSLHSLREEQG